MMRVPWFAAAFLALAPSIALACPTPHVVDRADLGARCIGVVGDLVAACVVYESGRVAASRSLFYQLQGTGPSSDSARYPACVATADWCAISIFRSDAAGNLRLIGHAESDQLMPYYFRPYVVATPSGQLVVSESQSSGTGHYTDDFVFRFDSQCLRRVDVQSWKGEASSRTTRTSTSTDWWISYRTMVGEQARMSERGDEWYRQPGGGHVWATLVLEGDALVARSIRTTDTPDRY